MPFTTASRRPDTAAHSDAAETQPSARVANWKRCILSAVALSIIGYFALAQVSRWPERLRYPGEEDAVEGTQLSEMVHLRRGIQIYRTPTDGEFDGAIYGPLFYLLGAAVINPDRPAYLPLRLVSLAATLAVAVFAGMLVFRLTGSRLGCALAPLVILSTAYIGRYGISARADMVALFLSFAGFLVFFWHQDEHSSLIFAALLMLLSIFYKQQFIGAPTSVLLYLAATKRIRAAVIFACALALGAGILVAAFAWVVFPHQHFLTHFVLYNRLPPDKSAILPGLLTFAIPLFVPLLASADYLDSHKNGLLKSYALISVMALLLLSSGSGADTNRCLEATVVLSCLMAARLATTPGLFSGIAWTAALTCTLILVAALGSAFVIPRVPEHDFLVDRALQSYLRINFSAGTSALTYFPGDALRAGMTIPVTNLWHYSTLLREAVLSDTDVVNRINRGGYGVILLDFDLSPLTVASTGDFYTTRPMRQAILADYREQSQLELPASEMNRFSSKTIHVWVPRTGALR